MSPRYCDWPGCRDLPTSYLRHKETGSEKAYCREHTPDMDSNTWEVSADG